VSEWIVAPRAMRNALTLLFAALAACSSSDPSNGQQNGDLDPTLTPNVPDPQTPGEACKGTSVSSASPAHITVAMPDVHIADGLTIEIIGTADNARQLAALPNGDLLVATNDNRIWIFPNAEQDGAAGTPSVFATLPESPAQGITFVPNSCTIYVGTRHHVYAMTYSDGQMTGTPSNALATFRQGKTAGTNGDNDEHITTSLAYAAGKLYAGIGSSCNACKESDITRATIQIMNLDGSNMTTRATRFRNAIALAENPATSTLWAGGAGQDQVDPGHLGHPYEFFDAVTTHAGVADYGWPECEENHNPFKSGANCDNTVAPLVEFPAYSTLIGAAFYPLQQTGEHVFPAHYRGGVFITTHGSWHQQGDGTYFSPPRVAYVPMTKDVPNTAVNWDDPTTQWTDVVSNLQHADGTTRTVRPTGIAVGREGSLFFADDFTVQGGKSTGYIFRVRPQ
jgi:glucose/arabinose dehydrogenase